MSKLNPAVIYLLAVFVSCGKCFANSLPQQSPQADQYINEKPDQKVEQISDDPDSYHLTNEFKPDQQQFSGLPWNPYRLGGNFPKQNRFPGYFGYPSPILVPYPVLVQPEFVYPYAPPMDEYDDQMSRSNTRRTSAYRNSPIYYVRVPPSPYMFVPGLGYTSQPPSFTPNFSPMFHHYNPIPALPIQPPINSIINLPLNFLANGKPTNLFQLDANEIQQPYQPFIPPRPYRPAYSPYTPDSKITHLKRPFLFNGKPEDIYLLQNSFNPMQSMYQQPLQGYQPPLQGYQPPLQGYQPPLQGYY